MPVEPCGPGVRPDEPAGPAEALDWFAAERPVVMAAVERAADEGFPAHAWQLAWTIKPWQSRQWHREEQIRAQRTAVTAAARDGNRPAQAVAYRYLADGLARLARYGAAEETYQQALDLYLALGDRAGQAHTHLDLARMLDGQRRHRDALARLERALGLFRASGDRVGEARALAALGWEHAQLADYEPALVHCRAAVELLQAAGDRTGEGACWDSIGYIHHQRGDFPSAISCFERALDVAERFGDRNAATQTLVHLGESRLAAGDPEGHREAWLRAVAILDGQDPQAAAALRARLGQTARPALVPQQTRPAGSHGAAA
jgi:tetratricopeptide (TPR) repeat protein